MAHPSKTKGSNFERELVNEARALGLDAERAWGSNGKAFGESEEVDIKVQGMRLQAKRRARLPRFLMVPEGCDGTVFRSDRGETLVLMRWGDVMDQLKEHGW
jgi:hypothetical protein